MSTRTPSKKIVSIDGLWGKTANGFEFPLIGLTRQELIGAAKVKFPDVKGNRWLTCSKETILNAILSEEVPEGLAEGPPPALAGPATEKQLSFIRRLGGLPPVGINKADASDLIDALVAAPQASTNLAITAAVPAAPPTSAQEALVQLSGTDTPEATFTALVQHLAAQVSAPVDLAAVKAEAIDAGRQAIAELSADLEAKIAGLAPHVTRVEIAGREPIELEGRQHASFPDVLRILGAGLHVYLVGPPGTGKSTLAHQAANALGIPFGTISLDPTLPPSRLFGYQDATGNYVRTLFRDIYEGGGVFLFDEIDNGHPGILASINQALSNGHCSFPDGLVEKHKDCRIVASANTHGTGPTRAFVGRNQLDAATLDRFCEVEVAIDLELEEALTLAECPGERGQLWLERVRAYRRKAEEAGLQLIFSPRAAIEGARLLTAGFTTARAIQLRLEKGLPEDVLRKVRP